MRVSRVFAVVACLLAVSAGANGEPTRLAAVAPLPERLAPAADPFSLAVLVELTARAARSKVEPTRTWLSQLGTFYATRTTGALWVADDGAFHPAVDRAWQEIARADQYGLDAKQYARPALPNGGSNLAQRVRSEVDVSLALATYAWHAQGGRYDPSQLSKWLDHRPRPVDAAAVAVGVAQSDDPARTIREFHPRHPAFEALRQAYVKARGIGEPEKALPVVPPGPRIKPGETHMDVRYVRRRLNLPGRPGSENVYDTELVEAVAQYMRSIGGRGSKRVIDDDVRAMLNAPPRPAAGGDWKRLLANMERWRYLPADQGDLYVWNNLPEFETRVVKGGKVIHQERIIIGKSETQTPVFSDQMRYVVFKPEWGVPNSIKIRQLLPHMQDGDYDELERRNMRILINGKTKDPGDYDWDRTDIRYVPIVQGAGDDNPLGELKFMFPNKHAVYMHDTPNKSLFNTTQRTHSAGCIRVRNPRRLAEVVFGEVEGWDGGAVASRLKRGVGIDNDRTDLSRSIPVHNTYFTIVPDDKGGLKWLGDIYGHDRRMVRAIDGESWDSIAADDPAVELERDLEDLAPTKAAIEEKKPTKKRGYARY